MTDPLPIDSFINPQDCTAQGQTCDNNPFHQPIVLFRVRLQPKHLRNPIEQWWCQYCCQGGIDPRNVQARYLFAPKEEAHD